MQHSFGQFSIDSNMDVGSAFELGQLDAHAQAALVKTGHVSPSELVEAAIIRIEHLNPILNVMTFRDYQPARRLAIDVTGEMAGVPWLVKDGLDYPGMPTRSGSCSRKNAKYATTAYPYAKVFSDYGLIALGKTNAPEFGLLPTTEPVLNGPTLNPWSRERSPGGSSGGAAVAVASGMAPLAHAADGAGSIRIPASCCGIVGLKPGRGANLRAREPHLIDDLIACDSLMSRSVRDVAWAFHAAAPQNAGLPKDAAKKRLRIAVINENLDGRFPSPEVAEVIAQTAKLCASLGHDVEESPLPVKGAEIISAFRTLWAHLARETVTNYIRQSGEDCLEQALEPWTRDLAAWSEKITIFDTQELYEQVHKAGAALDAFFTQYDCILSPVLRQSALPIGELAPTRDFDHIMEVMFDYVSYTPLHNITGHPALSLPLYNGPDGVPIGSMFAAARGREALLLDLAYTLEEAQPWASRWPPLSTAFAPQPSSVTPE